MQTATSAMASAPDLAAAVEEITAPLNVTARAHARDIDSGQEVSYRADDLVAMASTFKVPILLELCRQASQGRLDLRQRVGVEPSQRTIGPTGISVMLDPIELSLRDLALLMMAVSDNTATDVILDLVGVDAVNATLAEVGLSTTKLVGDCRMILDGVARAVGAESSDGVMAHRAGLPPEEQAAVYERVRGTEAVDPTRTTRSTAHEASRLLDLIWKDEAGPPAACAEVRRILALQVWPHRLRAGFPDSVAVAGKTGTLPFWRGEIGVATYPDGARYAMAVYLELPEGHLNDPDADRAIGRIARLAVDALRS